MARKRKKYDTEALVGQLKAERRTGILLTFVGVGILGGLAALYFTGVGKEEIAEVPKEGETAADSAKHGAPAGKPDDKATDKPAEPVKPADPPPPKAADKPGMVHLVTKKPIAMWMDEDKLGKVAKKKDLEVPAGKHTV